ncbi:zinc finger, CCHC-type containing protein [Tanacetum coccineum]
MEGRLITRPAQISKLHDRRTSKIRNDFLMFQQHQGESLSEASTRFKDLLQKVPHHGINLWLQIQIFYDHVSFHLKHEIDRAVGGKLHDKNAEESWEIIENLAFHDHDGTDKDMDIENVEVVDKNVVGISELTVVEPSRVVDKEKEVKDEMNNEPIRSVIENITDRQVKGELIEGLVGNKRFNDSLLEMQLGLKYMDALVDQGSNVNVMPLFTYNRLTNENLIETDIRLSLASQTHIQPLGIAEDVLVEIAGLVYPMDFVILDIKEDKKKPFILGTPFLTTAKAEIRFDKETITLKLGKKQN